MSSRGSLRRCAASRRPNSNISSAAGFENGRWRCASSSADRVLGVLVAEQPVADLDDVAALVLRDAEDLGEHLHRELAPRLAATKSNSPIGQRPVEDLARDLADLLLPHADRARGEVAVTISRAARRGAAGPCRSSTCAPRSRPARGPRARCRRARRRTSRRPVDGADVGVAGDRPEARPVGLVLPVDRVLAAQRRERLVRDALGERGVVGEVDELESSASWRLEVVQVLVELPVRDLRAVALDLEALHRQERVDDLGAERARMSTSSASSASSAASSDCGQPAPSRRAPRGRRRPRAAAAARARRGAVDAGGEHARRSPGTGWRRRRRRGSRAAWRRRARAGCG